MLKKKRSFALFMAIGMALSMVMTAFPAMAQSETEITVLHSNDVHSRVEGEAYLSAYAKALKEEKKNVLLLSAGDVLHGQPLATISRGESIVEIMNAVGYDAMVPGNHDFNYGFDRLKELEKDMDFALISANVVYKDTQKPAFTQYLIKDIGGVKVGIFGLSTPETATKTNPKNVEKVEFTPPVAAAEAMVKELKGKGAQVIIALTHLGVDEETLSEERSTALGAVEGIDLVVDGHSHTEMPEGRVEGKTTISQTGEYLNNFGQVSLKVADGKVTEKKASLIPLSEEGRKDLKTDQAVLDTISSVEKANEKITSEIIGKTPVKLDGEREDVRTHETNLSNLLTDSMLAVTGADLAITNGGGIRASIEAGDISKGDVLTVLPFGNFICTIKITGQSVLDALEHGLDSYPESAGHYAQVAGIKVVFDASQKAGSRISSVTMQDGKALDPKAEYVVATNDFMASGGDDYSMFTNNSAYMEFGALDEALIDYIASGVDISKIDLDRVVNEKREAPAEDKTSEEENAAPDAEEDVDVAEPEEAIPDDAEEDIPADDGNGTYTVVKGDNLSRIGKRFGTDWRKIVKTNNIKNPNLILPGQVLILPEAA